MLLWLIPAGLLGLFLLARDKAPTLANGAINKTNKPTTLRAPGTFAPVFNVPKGETLSVLGSGMVASAPGQLGPGPVNFVVVVRQGSITPLLVPVADLAGI